MRPYVLPSPVRVFERNGDALVRLAGREIPQSELVTIAMISWLTYDHRKVPAAKVFYGEVEIWVLCVEAGIPEPVHA